MTRNRNQRQRANYNSQPSKKYPTQNASNRSNSGQVDGVLNNAISEARAYFNSWPEQPLRMLIGTIAFTCSIITLVDILGGINTTQTYNSNSGLLSVFGARILAFLVIAASLGWSISMVGIWLTKNNNDMHSVIAHIFTAFGAVFMSACIGHIFKSDIDRAPYVVLMFSILGATIAIFLAKTNFKQTLSSDLEVTASRAALLMNFATVTAVLVVFTQITGLS